MSYCILNLFICLTSWHFSGSIGVSETLRINLLKSLRSSCNVWIKVRLPHHFWNPYIAIHPWKSAATNLSFPNRPKLAYRLPVEFSIAYPGGGNKRKWREDFNIVAFRVQRSPHYRTKHNVLLDCWTLMFSISFLKYAKIIYLCILVESSLNHCTCILDQLLMGRDLTPLPVASSFGASCKSNFSLSRRNKAYEQKST